LQVCQYRAAAPQMRGDDGQVNFICGD
jgi:hypothetical protein